MSQDTRKVIHYEDQPLLHVGDRFDRFNHMLKKRDRETVPLVMDYLYGNNIDVYLGGKVVSDWLFSGARNYDNISLLGEGYETSVSDLVRRLSSYIEHRGGFIINNTHFDIARGLSCETDERSERFVLSPEGILFRPSRIAVSLILK